MTVNGLAIPPVQNSSQSRSTRFFNSTVIIQFVFLSVLHCFPNHSASGISGAAGKLAISGAAAPGRCPDPGIRAGFLPAFRYGFRQIRHPDLQRVLV